MLMLNKIPVVKTILQVRQLPRMLDDVTESLQNGGGEKLRRCVDNMKAARVLK